MRSAFVALLGIALTACGGDTVDVRFAVPTACDAVVTTLRLSVMAPRESTLDCDALALGRVAEADRRASTLSEQTLEGDEPVVITGVPRRGRKLFVVEALDAEQRLMAAGCAPEEDIDSDVTIAITGEHATVLDASESLPFEPFVNPLDVTVDDVCAGGGASQPIHWLAAGGAGEVTAGQSPVAVSGQTSMIVEGPARPGPGRVEIASRWMRHPPLERAYFCSPTPAFVVGEEITPRPVPTVGSPFADSETIDDDVVVGRFGPGGEPSVAMLGSVNVVDAVSGIYARRLEVHRLGAAPAAIDFEGELAAIPTALGKHPATADADVLIASTPSAWLRITHDGGTSLVSEAGATPPPGPVGRFAHAGSCDGLDGLLLAQLDGATTLVDANGGFVSVEPNPFAAKGSSERLLGSGCVDDGAGEARRVVAYDTGDVTLRLVDDDGADVVTPSYGPPTIGFAPALGGAAAALLPIVDPDGWALGRFVLGSSGGSLELDLITRDATALVSRSPVAGDFDGDGIADVAAIVIAEDEEEEASSFAIVAALGAEFRDRRLRAFSTVFKFPEAVLRTADFDADGNDDLLIASRDGFAALLMTRQGACP